MNRFDKRTLWLRWVVANGLGEMLGLGLTFAVGAWVIFSLEVQHPSQVILLTFVVAVASGAIEATLVGFLQWWALRPWFPGITRLAWWRATLIGALVAYVLGYSPSVLIDLTGQASPAAGNATEPGIGLVLLLAAGLGLVGGAVLSFAQYLVMRRSVRSASIWIPANMLAWLVGMPLIFWGIDTAQKLDALLWVFPFIAGVLLLTGVLVGSIHGVFLVHLAGRAKIDSP